MANDTFAIAQPPAPPHICDICGKDMRNARTGGIDYGLYVDAKQMPRIKEMHGDTFVSCVECWVGGQIEAMMTFRQKATSRDFAKGCKLREQ